MKKRKRIYQKLGITNEIIKLSDDREFLIINKKIYSLKDIKNIECYVDIHDVFDLLVDKSTDYNFFKGYALSELFDNKFGLLGGFETTKYYQTVVIKKVVIRVTFNRLTLNYNMGFFQDDDFLLMYCYDDNRELCEDILSAIKDYKYKYNIVDKEDEPGEITFVNIIKWIFALYVFYELIIKTVIELIKSCL